MTDIARALTFLRPNDEWLLDGDTYSGLSWLADTPKPTEQELSDADELALQAAIDKELQADTARNEAITHAKSLGFTDAMISVMYPNLGAPNV
jgi:hypothetical protein